MGSRHVQVTEAAKFSTVQGSFARSGQRAQFLAAMEGACNKWVLMVVAHIREKGFQMAADAREVRVNRGRFNIVGHIN